MGNNPSNLKPRHFDGTALQPKDVPPPTPCKTTKEVALDTYDFKVLDQHACKAPKELLRKTWWDLADYLTGNDSFDRLAKVRSIFRWITSYDIENYDIDVAPPANSPLEYFGKIQSDMGDYANLFFILCSVANVKCVVIDGITKSSAYEVGDPLNKESMKAHWNAVYLKKEWRFVDCFWASKCDFVDEGNQTRMDGDKRFTKILRQTTFDDGEYDDDDDVHNKEPNEFYFFTDPDKLINTHLPRDPNWQLLVTPITEEEFEKQAYLRERFLLMRVKIANKKYDKCKIIADKGEAMLEFKLPPERSKHFRFKYLMYKNETVGSSDKKIDKVLDRFIMFQHKEERLKLKIRFPVAGIFKLDIFGMDSEELKLFDILCTYMFVCEVPVDECYPLPDNPLIGWGPGIDATLFNVMPITHMEATIITEDGKEEIRVQGSKDLSLYMQLKNPFISNSNLSKYAMLRFKDGEYIVNTRLPKQGEYALNLYARDKEGKKKSYNVLNYLIQCIGKDIKETPYPNLAQETLGAHPSAEALGVKCIGCEDGLVDAKEGKANVEFQTAKDDIHLLCELQANDPDSPERLRVAPNRVNGRQAFALDLPTEGEYAMNVFGLLKKNPDKIHNIHALLVHSGGRQVQAGTNKRAGTGSKNFWKDIGQLDIEVIKTKESEVIVPVPFGVPNVLAFLERKGSGEPASSKNIETIQEDGVPLYKVKLDELGEYVLNIYQRDEGMFIRNFMRYIIRRTLTDDAVENDLDIIMSTIKEERIKDGNDVSGIDSRKDDFVEHKKQRVDVFQKVAAAQQLQKVMDTKNPKELKKAIDEYKDASKTKNGIIDDPLLANANKQYKTLKAKTDLSDAYQKRELTDLDKAIAQAKKANADQSLDVQLLLAQRLRERIAVMRRIRDTVMKTDPKTISEVRQYNTPPDGAHQSIAAALLMVGYPLKEVEDWKQCQKHLAKRGDESVRSKMAKFDPRRVPKENAEYAKGMMDEVTVAQVEKSCPMASAFCKWAKEKIQQTEDEVGPLESAPSDLEKSSRKKRGKGSPEGQQTSRSEKEQPQHGKVSPQKDTKGKIVPIAQAQKGVKGNQGKPNQTKGPSPKDQTQSKPKSIPLVIQLDKNNADKIDVKASLGQPNKKQPKTMKSSPVGYAIPLKSPDKRPKPAGNQKAPNTVKYQPQPHIQKSNQNGFPNRNNTRFPSDSSNELNFTPSELTQSDLSTVPSGDANVITFQELFNPQQLEVKQINEPNKPKGPIVREQKPNISYLSRHKMRGTVNQNGNQPIKEKSDPEIVRKGVKYKMVPGYGARHQMRKMSSVN